MLSLFRFRQGRASGLGVGVEGLALEKPQTDPLCDGFNVPRYNVKRSMNPQTAGMVQVNRGLTAVDLQGYGSGFTGQLNLQGLSRITSGEGS